ncbi:MAG: hypothetical protein OXU96_04605 [Gammaproteobacteria bacterium]|nr:hypothetical protein [Gammaproteobacteria bacterium]
MAEETSQPRYTRNVLMQMLAVFVLLGVVVVWQWDVVRQIYLKNQINEIGWAINGSIMVLFFCGLGVLIWRFLEYRGQEFSMARLRRNLSGNIDPMQGLDRRSMLAERYLTLLELNRRRADINHNALAATLLAAESSRNSFLKFVHNVLILTGVFGTIVSLSLSLLGASDMIHGNAQASGQASGLGTMIFGMSTALSTTMTAILAYLIFGYFYIKLTDTQTYLISAVEEVTATTLLPHLRPGQQAAESSYSESMRGAADLIERLQQSQHQYEDSIQALVAVSQTLSRQLAEGRAAGGQEQVELLMRIGELQQQSTAETRELLSQVVRLLQEGFRLHS